MNEEEFNAGSLKHFRARTPIQEHSNENDCNETHPFGIVDAAKSETSVSELSLILSPLEVKELYPTTSNRPKVPAATSKGKSKVSGERVSGWI
uniref:Uncharacterized protein n=2 Tax=Phlebotomus papatasi TaxID=29031 RepID=A0A1B0DDI9_PHLPP